MSQVTGSTLSSFRDTGLTTTCVGLNWDKMSRFELGAQHEELTGLQNAMPRPRRNLCLGNLYIIGAACIVMELIYLSLLIYLYFPQVLLS